MTNHVCVFLWFDYPCDMDHESESNTKIWQKVLSLASGRTPSSGHYQSQICAARCHFLSSRCFILWFTLNRSFACSLLLQLCRKFKFFLFQVASISTVVEFSFNAAGVPDSTFVLDEPCKSATLRTLDIKMEIYEKHRQSGLSLWNKGNKHCWNSFNNTFWRN